MFFNQPMYGLHIILLEINHILLTYNESERLQLENLYDISESSSINAPLISIEPSLS